MTNVWWWTHCRQMRTGNLSHHQCASHAPSVTPSFPSKLIPHHVCLLDMKQAVYFSTVRPFQTGLSTKKTNMCKQHWAWKCRLLIVISGKHVHLHIHELIQSCCSSTEEEIQWLQVSSIDVPIKYRKPNKILFRFDIKMLLGDLTISVNESKLGQRFSGLSDQMSVSGVYADVCLATLKPNRSTLLF